jgi:hypothetical protein
MNCLFFLLMATAQALDSVTRWSMTTEKNDVVSVYASFSGPVYLNIDSYPTTLTRAEADAIGRALLDAAWRTPK